MVQFATIDSNQVKRSELVKLFLDINCGGVPQTEEHLQHVREIYQEMIDKGE